VVEKVTSGLKCSFYGSIYLVHWTWKMYNFILFLFFQFGPLNIKIQTWQETQWATTVGLLQTPALKSTGRQKHLKILEIIFFFTAAERDLVDQFGNDSKMEKGNFFVFIIRYFKFNFINWFFQLLIITKSSIYLDIY